MVHFPKSLQCLSWFLGIYPPRSNRVLCKYAYFGDYSIHDGTVNRRFNLMKNGIPSFYSNRVCPNINRPLFLYIKHLCRIFRISYFLVKVLIVIFKHGQAQTMVFGMSHKTEGYSGQVVFIKAEARILHVGFKPHRWLGEIDVRIITKQDRTGSCLLGSNNPPGATFQERHW